MDNTDPQTLCVFINTIFILVLDSKQLHSLFDAYYTRHILSAAQEPHTRVRMYE